ncbi:hypothetical protein PV08_00585 [Exophiala spinifera]|uniref:Uncharacterized protein n=1 Tax=Exophiala spinifera TaxID=91928 RepID=A0A0D2BNB6_9EURO|nr:uncharacterized protein PV08_00585 [Exophiala spinifera]KIW20010.1 hypothetical protein PV08_00585 [Exophiala spinifera]
MVDVTITLSTPGLHTAPVDEAVEYPFEGESDTRTQQAAPPETATRSNMVCHTTQTDPLDDEMVTRVKSSTGRSRSPSPSRKPRALKAWTEQIRNRLSSPQRHRVGPVTIDSTGIHLAPPTSESPLRPATPAADLYRGQEDGNFGMTFEQPDHPHLRKGRKPLFCHQNYEDHKHRMMMDWVERRG